MHPVFSNPARTRVFLIVWPLVGTAAGVLPFWWAGGAIDDWWALALWGQVLAVPVLASTFVCHAAPLSSSSPWRVLATVGVGALVTAGLWIEVGRAWLGIISPWTNAPLQVFSEMSMPAVLGAALLFGLGCTVNYALIAGDERQAESARALHAEVSAREAELRALRAQIDPHFLFNCLHSISSLIGSDPGAARQMCIGSAAFFRESLRAGTQARIPLSDEVSLVTRYLELERLRFGHRLGVSVSLAQEASAVTVPPLLLQPLAENAVRHGIATLLDGGVVTLTISREARRVSVRVDNPHDPDERRAGIGIGLANVKARLEATYGPAASIRAEHDASTFSVLLSLPAEELA